DVYIRFTSPVEAMVPGKIIGISFDADSCGFNLKVSCNTFEEPFSVSLCNVFENIEACKLYHESEKRKLDAKSEYERILGG
ncbi:hypothetical protein, partial [Bacillus cereus]|uniref:hypothetical protein n=1 Tax=Bacillus cereus TaxID=1396 RepID=UPI0034D673DC